MSAGLGVATAVTFVWCGMVAAISFMEAPLKFRAPEVTMRIGLGIGRLVFRALNTAEACFAIVLVVCAMVAVPPTRVAVTGAVAVLALVVQLVFLRPCLARRSNRVLAGEDVPRSGWHYLYVGLEVLKLTALLGVGVLLLAL